MDAEGRGPPRSFCIDSSFCTDTVDITLTLFLFALAPLLDALGAVHALTLLGSDVSTMLPRTCSLHIRVGSVCVGPSTVRVWALASATGAFDCNHVVCAV